MYVDWVADDMAVVQAPSEYHWYEYGEVPPVGFAERMMDWPVSIEGDAGVTGPAEIGPLTVTVSPGEHAEGSGVPCEESEAL